mgnify:CR=1 FL=1|jgi:hypothetical protein
MRAFRKIVGLGFLFSPILLWMFAALTFLLLEWLVPACQVSGAGATGCGKIGTQIYEFLMLMAYFGIIGQLLWVLPALFLIRLYERWTKRPFF